VRRQLAKEDVTQYLIRFVNGAVGTIGSSRVGTGRKLGLDYEIQGAKGALGFTQERMNELQLYRHTDPSAERGCKTVYIGPDHPGYDAAFHPIPGIGLGYNDQKIIEARELICAVPEGRPAEPDFAFGQRSQNHRRGREAGQKANARSTSTRSEAQNPGSAPEVA
jgi:predicted dehydrogenase